MAQSFGSGGDDDEISGINVTPLVDVILVLLIIFMITAPVIYQSAIRVQLPSAASGEKTNRGALSFTLSKEGTLSWDKETISWETLKTRLDKLSEQGKADTATISADQATPHGTVVRLMDTLQQAGLSRFALNVDAVAKKSDL